jgi:hypothetical protein
MLALVIPDPVHATGDPGYYVTRPTTHVNSGLTITNPEYAYDNILATYAHIKVDVVGSFTVRAFDKGAFTSNDVIAMVDISMDYDHPGGGKGQYKIAYYVNPALQTGTETILEAWSDLAHSGTETWKDVKDPNDLVWSWSDIANIQVVVACGNIGGGGAKYLDENEVWVTVYYYSPPTLYVDPTSTTKGVTESFAIDINITGFTAGNWSGGVYGWEFKLKYDGTLLNGTGITEGAYLGANGTTTFWKILYFNDATGLAWSTCTLIGDVAGKTGGGILATVSFDVKATGSCALDLNFTKLSGYDFPNKRIYTISHTAVDGTFQTTAGVPEFPYGAALEIGIAAVLVFVWWKRTHTKGSPTPYQSSQTALRSL